MESLRSPSANFLSSFLFGNKLSSGRGTHTRVVQSPPLECERPTSGHILEENGANSCQQPLRSVWGLVSFFLIHAGTLTGSVLCSDHSCCQSMCGSVMSHPADISECSCPYSGSQSLHISLFHSVSRGVLGKNSTKGVGYTFHLLLRIHSPFFSVPGRDESLH